MSLLKYHVAVSIDGYIAAADDTYDGFLAEGDHVTDYIASWSGYGAIVMGRRTYEMGLRVGVTNPYPMMKTYVVSRTLASPDPAVTIVDGDPVEFLRGLKQREERPIYLAGGGKLAATAFEAGLIDEVIAKLNPLVLGSGIPLFGHPVPQRALVLRDTQVYPSGVVVLTYRVPAR